MHLLYGVFAAWFVCWAVVAALLHELGHWAAARLAGAPVPRVVIGTGPRLVAFRWAGTLWDVHRYPVAGQARAALVAPRLARTKLVAIVAAGPLANAALLALCAAGGGATWLVAGAWANALHLGLSLFPWRCRSPQGPVLSDGLQIALLPRLSTAALHERLAAGHRAISLELCLAGDMAGAVAELERARGRFPRSMNVANDLAVAYLAQHRVDQARGLFRLVHASGPTDPLERAVIENNLAFTLLLSGSAGDLAAADELSARALAAIGWHPAVRGTRGAILVERGRIEDGRELLLCSMEQHARPADQALNRCYLAITDCRAGRFEAARGQLALARALDPSCLVLPRAESALALAGETAAAP